MNKLHPNLLVLSLIMLQSCATYNFKQSIWAENTSTSFHEKVDSIVIDKMNQYNIPGLSIGVVKNDSIVYNKGFGISRIHKGKSVTENSLFHTASISKLFTALAIMKLVDQDKLALDDKLVKLLPALKYKDKRVENISIQNLLNHTSGIPDIKNYHWKNNKQGDKDLGNYVLASRLKLDFDPSAEFQYSNLAYDILGYVIEKVSGSNFDDFLKENILDESKMYSSDFRYFKIQDTLKTHPHSIRRFTKNIYERKTYPYTRAHAPSSTLNSSSRDLSMWMIDFLHSLADSDTSDRISSMTKPTFSPYPYIGLGFQLSVIKSKNTIGHYGGDKGFRSYLVMIPEEKIGLVLLANCDYEEDFRQEILHPIADLLLKQ